VNAIGKIAWLFGLLSGAGWGQPELEMQRLVAPRLLEFSADGSRLWYKLGAEWWRLRPGRIPGPNALLIPLLHRKRRP